MANTVTFSSTETDICIDGLWQYDIGQTLDIMGLVPTGTPEMHWAYSALADLTPAQTIDIRTMTEVTTGEGEAAETYYTVDIPDLALSTADEVVGYIYDEDTGTGETIAVVRFYVEEREQPTDYVSPDNTVTLQDLVETAVDAAIPTFEIGTVEAGEAPAAALVETETGYALDLTLQTGATGPQGPTGPTGPQGPTGPTGPAGADGESIEVQEISEAAYLAIETPDVRVLYVVDCTIHVVSVSLDYSSGQIRAGNTFQLIKTILPINAADKTVSWSSSDTDVATVDENGLVTGVADGTCTITCTTTDGSKTATFTATVITTAALWSGEKVYNGLTMLIETDENGDTYITMTGTTSATALGYFTENIPLVFDITGIQPWYTMNAGDVLSLTTQKISGTAPNSNNTCFSLKEAAGAIILLGPTFKSPNGTYTTTLSGNKTILGFVFYVAATEAFSSWKLKVTFSVNGQKWF
jgi:uncharacterized protein YjdB